MRKLGQPAGRATPSGTVKGQPRTLGKVVGPATPSKPAPKKKPTYGSVMGALVNHLNGKPAAREALTSKPRATKPKTTARKTVSTVKPSLPARRMDKLSNPSIRRFNRTVKP